LVLNCIWVAQLVVSDYGVDKAETRSILLVTKFTPDVEPTQWLIQWVWRIISARIYWK